METAPWVHVIAQMPARLSSAGTWFPVIRLNKKLSSISISTAEENNAKVCTPSRLLRSNSRAIAVMRNPPSTPARLELADAAVSGLQLSDVQNSSGFIAVPGRAAVG